MLVKPAHQFCVVVLTVVVMSLGCDQPIAQDKIIEGGASRPTQETEKENTKADPQASKDELRAKCELIPIGNSGVSGMVRLIRTSDGKVLIRGTISGLTPGLHGFHVHEKGDLSDKETGKSAGGHFNPTNKKHGKPSDSERHVGDLGNIKAGDDGVAVIRIEDSVIKLSGEHSVMGLPIVVHAGEDHFTQPTGDSGDRVAFGLIEKDEVLPVVEELSEIKE